MFSLRPSGRIAVHVFGWLLFFSLIIAFVSTSFTGSGAYPPLFSPSYLAFYVLFIGLFYLNYSALFPFLFLKGKYWLYFLIFLLCLALVYYLQPFEHLHNRGLGRPGDLPPPAFDPQPPPSSEGSPPQPPRGRERIDIISLITFFLVWAVSTAIVVIRFWRDTEKRAAQAETDRANAELSFLKAQINPHFMFNTLNNIYSMAVSKSDDTAPAVMKLSNIMRYVTDEANQDLVDIDSELDCIRNYIDLQKFRLSSKTSVKFEVAQQAYDQRIPPLILMTFVENAFKHGISSHEECEVFIRIEVKTTEIRFHSKNRIFGHTIKSERKGIGIRNTKQRLEHVYPDKHELRIVIDEYYTVDLSLFS